MYWPSCMRSNCSSVSRRLPLTTTGSSLRLDDRLRRYSWAAARSCGLTLCTGRAAVFGIGAARLGDGGGTTATVALGLAAGFGPGVRVAGVLTAGVALAGVAGLAALPFAATGA